MTRPAGIVVVVAAALAAAGCVSGARDRFERDDGADVALARAVSVPLAEAVATAIRARPGEAVDARIETAADGGQGAATIVVAILFTDAAGTMRRAVVSVDPHSGRAIYVRNDRDAPTVADALRATLAAPHRTLPEVIDDATHGRPGRAVFAALGDPGPNLARVRIVRGAVVEETTIGTARAAE